ncbi:hypothetical protein K439DRAFT_1625866 [Ramaria rubella]|nr:hypothetical protein K439DRAFT_1625866 [Ramaria rubella]
MFLYKRTQPHNSRMFSSWGVNYRVATGSQGGRTITSFVRSSFQGDSPVAVIEWGRGGAPGRICLGKQWFAMSDFLRLEAVDPYGFTRNFISPRGGLLKWTPDPRSHSLLLIDGCTRSYGRLDPIPEKRLLIDGKYRRIGFVLSFAHAGANLELAQIEHILVTLLLYRCLAINL